MAKTKAPCKISPEGLWKTQKKGLEIVQLLRIMKADIPTGQTAGTF